MSIIVPIYNKEDLLRRCVDSIIAQTYANLEIILVDDGSTDDSGEICDAYAAKDNRVIAIHKENGGVSSARNVGLKTLTGDYVGFVDADDYVSEIMYEKLLALIMQTDADIAQCSFYESSAKVDIIADKAHTNDDIAVMRYDNEEGMRNFLSGHSFHMPSPNPPVASFIWNKLFSRDVVDDLYFNEQIENSEDLIFVTEAVARSRLTVVTDEKLYYHTFSQYSLSHMTSYRKMKGQMLVPGLYKTIINKKFPQLTQQATNAVAFIYVAIYNRLLGHRRSFSADESNELEKRLIDHFKVLKTDVYYPNIDFRLRAAMSLAIHFPFVNRIAAAIFHVYRNIQYRRRYG
jgi:glycosyltransferase involved in cell wall biosynthesis